MISPRLFVCAAALLAALCAVEGRRTRGVGTPMDISEAPWLVQFEYSPKKDGDFSIMTTCAGNIIDETHILTAAHCFDDEDIKYGGRAVQARVGATVKKSGGQVYQIESIIPHPNAKGGKNGMYDLAVVIVSQPIEFSDKVQPIPIAKETIEPMYEIKGGGWGFLPDMKSFAPGLSSYSLIINPHDGCQKALLYDVQGIPKDAIGGLLCCTAVRDTLPCKGDSGSGLWTIKRRVRPSELIGILHASTGGCNVGQGVPLYVDILHEDLRPFLSQFFDMSGCKLNKTVPPAA